MLKRLLGTIQGKLIGLFLLLIVFTLATITYLFYQATRSALVASVKSHLETIIQNKSETISSWMQEREHDVEVLSKNGMLLEHLKTLTNASPQEAAASRGAMQSLLKLVRDQYGAYHEISVIDSSGRILASTARQPREIRGPALLRAIRQAHAYISDVHRYRDGPSLTLDIAVPIDPSAVAMAGAVVVKVDMDVVNQMTNSMRLMRSGEVYLVDQRGIVITHRDQRRIYHDNLSKIAGVKQVVHGASGVGEYTSYQGFPVVGAFRWLPRWRWGLIAEVEQSEAFAPIASARNELFLIAALIAAVAVLGILLIARGIVRPLSHLTHAVQAIALGKLDQHLEIGGHDEIGYLTSCFNQMAQSLAESREILDQRIREATSEFERANRELAQKNQELQDANRELERQRALVAQSARLAAMGEMAAGIAHEINNPLTTMKNLVHTMRGAHPADDVGDQDLSIIAEEIEKINRLVVNFLRYARPPKAKKKSLAPREVVEKTLDLLEPQIKQKRINIKRNLGQDAQRIFVDQEQLGQVYLNLLLNAIQASPEGAEIEVFVRSVFADSSDVPTRVELGVTDHGCGIRMEDRSRVFLPFFTTKSQGSGLGLAISQRIIEDHGGELSFTSRPDEETTFLISLSLQEERDEPAADR